MSVPVQFNVTAGDGIHLGVDRPMNEVLIRIGDWYVELRGGNLIVRSLRADATVLTVPAQGEKK